MIRRKIALLSAAVLVVGMLSACGNNDAGNVENNNVVNDANNAGNNNVVNDADNAENNNVDGADNTTDNDTEIVYISEINAADYVTLGEYKGIELTETTPPVSEDDVEQYINTNLLAEYTVMTPADDRTDVREGDTVNIDYAGYKDGVAFNGGTAAGSDLTIGSGAFIPGFEDGLIGSNVGDTVSLDLTFPENYPSAELAGASVVFEVTINSISIAEIPELTDELAQELDIGGCTTAQELRDYLYSNAESSYNSTLKDKLSTAVMANCIFKEELPEKLVDRYYDILIEQMSVTASSYGMDLTTYMQSYYNMDEETYTGRLRENAQAMAQQFVMLQAIADAEDLNMTDEEKITAREEWAADYGYGSVDTLLEQMGEETCDEYLMADKVMEFLLENAIINTNE